MPPFVVYYIIISYQKFEDGDAYYLVLFQFAIIYGLIISIMHLKTYSRYFDGFYIFAPVPIVSLSMFVDWSISLFLATIRDQIRINTPLIYLFNLAYGMAHFFPVFILQIGIFAVGYYLTLFIIFFGERMVLRYMRFRRQKLVLLPINQGWIYFALGLVNYQRYNY